MKLHNALTRATARLPRDFNFTGTWANELGSTMELDQRVGELTGRYISRVSSEHTPVQGILTGHANGELIAFTVLWPTQAITAWVGRHREEDSESVIETLWQMTTFGEDGDSGFWHSINAGADRFMRISEAYRSAEAVEP